MDTERPIGMEAVNRAGRPRACRTIASHRHPLRDIPVGNVGSPHRFSYTVMGDAVNVAARLEGANKQYQTSICISETVVAATGSALAARPLQKVAVEGRRQEFMAYELLGITGSADSEIAPSAPATTISPLAHRKGGPSVRSVGSELVSEPSTAESRDRIGCCSPRPPDTRGPSMRGR